MESLDTMDFSNLQRVFLPYLNIWFISHFGHELAKDHKDNVNN